MAQTEWAELFAPPPPKPVTKVTGLWRLPRWLLARLTAWEDWLTFVIAFFTFLGVAQSVQAADWVENMPSLALVGFLGLLCGGSYSHSLAGCQPIGFNNDRHRL